MIKEDLFPPAEVREYEEGAAAIAKHAGALCADIKRSDKANVQKALEAGRLLLRLRPMCVVGEWEPMLKKNGISKQRASDFMWGAGQPAEVQAKWESVAELRHSRAENNGQDQEDTSRQGLTGQDQEGIPTGRDTPPAESTNQPGDASPPDREPGDDTESEAAAEAEQAALPKDEVGHTLPDNLKGAFDALERFKEADGHTRAMQKLIDVLARAPGGEQLARCTRPVGPKGKTIHKTEELQALHRHLRFTRPYSVCPWCKGKGHKTCKGCSGAGWVTKTTWDGAEESIKEALACLR